MFALTREEVRRFFCDTWRKYRRGELLVPVEATALGVIVAHPEYHALLGEGERAIEREWTPESGEENPFLHLSLHLAIEEQLAIDQPPGIRARLAALARALGDEHAAKHVLLECLGHALWRASASGSPPDERRYVECVEERVRALSTS